MHPTQCRGTVASRSGVSFLPTFLSDGEKEKHSINIDATAMSILAMADGDLLINVGRAKSAFIRL